MSKKLMIVGGTGFLGYYTAKLALSKGYEVGSISILDDDLENKDLDSWYPKEIKNTILDVFEGCTHGHPDYGTPKNEERLFAFLDSVLKK